jgi:cell division protein ZapA (FtsZ GTPase activity inhibitor)
LRGVLGTDRNKLVLATLLAMVAMVIFSLVVSKWEEESAADERRPFDELVTRANDAAAQAAEELKRGSST